MTDSEKFEFIVDNCESKVIAALESDYLKKECGHVDFYVEDLDVGDFSLK